MSTAVVLISKQRGSIFDAAEMSGWCGRKPLFSHMLISPCLRRKP